MAAYGRHGHYFGSKKPGFENTCWIELIGFDNTAEDYGVQDFLDKCGFVPDRISFHLTSIDLVNTHRGMDKEYLLPTYACSYSSHAANDDRMRQDWTNYQLKGLVDVLHRHGIEAFASMFDLENPSNREDLPRLFTDLHPELKHVGKNGSPRQFIYMLKRFADGTEYLDFLRPKLLQFVRDYGLDGIQVADGISSPRMALENGDWSDDIVGRFLDDEKLVLPGQLKRTCSTPEEFEARATWIYANWRKQWMRHMTKRWQHFVVSVIEHLQSHGIEASVNSAWTKDPLEARYRYGTDYKAFAAAGIDTFVVEDVSSDLAILGEDDNGYHMGYEHRRFVHHEFLANLMCNKAAMPDTRMTPLFMIRDTLEQWDVLHHVPQAMQRAACANLGSFLVGKRGLVPVTSGPWFCLSDGLTKDEWSLVRSAWDNAYIDEPAEVPGFTVIWSDQRMENELDALLEKRRKHTARYLGELLSQGAPVRKIARIEELDYLNGDLLVINPALMPKAERTMLDNYKKGRIAYLGCLDESLPAQIASVSAAGETGFWLEGWEGEKTTLTSDEPWPENAHVLPEPVGGIWTHPLRFAPEAEGFIKACAKRLVEASEVTTLTGGHGDCMVHAVMLKNGKAWCSVENEAYYYALPTIHFPRKVKSIEIFTKPLGYPQQRIPNGIRLRVPGRGADVMEVTFED